MNVVPASFPAAERTLLVAGLTLLLGAGPAGAHPRDGAEHVSATQLRAWVAKTTDGLALHAVTADPASQTLIVRRDRSGEAELHSKANDVFVVQAGRAALLVGGRIEGGRQSAPEEWRGGKIVGARTLQLKKGDVAWIPAGTPHQLLVPTRGSFTYLVIKSQQK